MGRCRQSVMCILILGASTGCATTGPASRELLASLRNQPEIAVVHYTAPSFRRNTAAARAANLWWPGLFGAIQTGLAERRSMAEASKLAAVYPVEDPVARVKEHIAARLSIALALANLHTVDHRLSVDDLDSLRRELISPIIFDFKTVDWGVTSIPLISDRYRVFYVVRFRVVRLKDATILWEDTCSSYGRDDGPSWTLDALVANSGGLLRRELEQAADACAETLLAHFVG